MTSLAPFCLRGRRSLFFTMSDCKNMRALKFFWHFYCDRSDDFAKAEKWSARNICKMFLLSNK